MQEHKEYEAPELQNWAKDSLLDFVSGNISRSHFIEFWKEK